MERLTLACGGVPMNSVDDLTEDVLGKAEHVYEVTLGEEKYTFVEGVENPYSCTILIKGQNEHTIAQIKDAVRDGLRAVKNVIDDAAVVPGAGAFEIFAHARLLDWANAQGNLGKSKLGVRAYAEALLVIPKTLAENSGFDLQETLVKLLDAFHADETRAIGLDIDTGSHIFPDQMGIWDNYCVKRSVINLSSVLASQLLLVDEIMRAGRGSRPSDGAGGGADMAGEE